MNKNYKVEIGGTASIKRLDDFMSAIEELAAQYGDIEVKIIDEFFTGSVKEQAFERLMSTMGAKFIDCTPVAEKEGEPQK